MFIVSLTYKDLAGVDALLGAHREFLREQYGRGTFLMSGPKRREMLFDQWPTATLAVSGAEA